MSEVTALAPWFGSNRMLAHEVGAELAGMKWVGVPFAGGMCELAHIDARSIVVGDLHRHLINLARTVADDELRPILIKHLRRAAFHPDELDQAQEWCKIHDPQPTLKADLQAAYCYFVCCWMGRSHIAGTKDEFHGRLSTRWNANGGDSNVRYRSAVRSLTSFSKIVRRCNFSVLDVFEFLDRCEDVPMHGLYLDPPFPGPGDSYRHKFSIEEHRLLAKRLAQFGCMRVVCRFYDHPLIRELYPQGVWNWRFLKGRKQSNEASPECLLINGPSLAARPPGGLF